MGYLRHCTYCFGILFLVEASSVFGIVNTPSPSPGFFTRSYIAQQETGKQYHKDAVINFTKNLNIAIKNHKDLKVLSQSCGGCDVVLPAFDEYLQAQLPRRDYYGTTLFTEEGLIQENVKKLYGDRGTIVDTLSTLISDMLTTVIEDTDYLIQRQQDIASPDSYWDGDPSNSPYDLIDDMQKIFKLLFKDPPQYEGYMDTMQNDAPGLITGRFEIGQWAQGKNYEIDLASEVSSALGQTSDGSSEESSLGEGNDCESGFCTTLDFIYNDQYSTSGDGRNFINTSFEEIFSSGNDWLIKRGDKRNIACKGPPPVNHFQSNNDNNLSFKNIFRGLGIFVYQKTPRYAEMPTQTQEKKTATQKEKDTDALIAENFKKYSIDPENLMLYTQAQMVAQATPITSKAGDTAANQEHAFRIREDYQNAQRNEQTSQKIAENGNAGEGFRNIFRMFGSWMGSLNTYTQDTLKNITELDSRPPCQN